MSDAVENAMLDWSGQVSIGRPSLYDPAFCERVIEMGSKGYSLAQMAGCFGVTRQTMWNWEKEHPAFFDALSRAKELSLGWWEEAIRRGVFMGKEFNGGAWAIAMAGRFPGEHYGKNRTEISGPDGGPIQVEASPRRVLETRLERLGSNRAEAEGDGDE